jgi:hypothetical protein
MNVQEAVDAWQSQYAGQPPVGFMLRFSHEEAWTRLRFVREGAPPDQHEAQLIATRFDTVASSLFTGATVLVLAIRLVAGRADASALRELGAKPITPPESWLEALGGYLPNPTAAAFMAATVSWERGCLDRVWLAVAHEWIGRVAVFCPATGDALCPYDGGADVFVWRPERRAKMAERFRAWLPSAGATGVVAGQGRQDR